MRRGEVITVMGVGETKGWAGEGVMMWASVGRAAAREATKGGEERGIGEGGRGLMAERSASSGEEDVGGSTRVRPSRLIVWSLCLFQHG